jgi:hypothetical protein
VQLFILFVKPTFDFAFCWSFQFVERSVESLEGVELNLGIAKRQSETATRTRSEWQE